MLAADPRFSYQVFVPPPASDSVKGDERLAVVINVHGTQRNVEQCIDTKWRQLAIESRCAIIAPLFPTGAEGDDETGYARIQSKSYRSDVVLLSMLEELSLKRRQLDTGRVILAGFSGGAGFAHRLAYLHPQRLFALVVAAPGSVTLLDPTVKWPHGVQDAEHRFAETWRGVDEILGHLRRVDVHITVGSRDTHITSSRRTRSRLECSSDLAEQWSRHGVPVAFNVVQGIGHDAKAIQPFMVASVKNALQKYYARG